jgi:hypothetical protein
VQLDETLGFAWDTHAMAWEANYEILKKFVKRHGHCYIPAKERSIFAWAKRQRRQHKQWMVKQDSTMTEDRYRRLSILEFRWSNTGNKFD